MKFVFNEKHFDWDANTALYELKIEHQFLIKESEINEKGNAFLHQKVLQAIQEIKEYLNTLDVNLKPIKRFKDYMVIECEFTERKD